MAQSLCRICQRRGPWTKSRCEECKRVENFLTCLHKEDRKKDREVDKKHREKMLPVLIERAALGLPLFG